MSPPFQPFVNIFTHDYQETVVQNWNERSVKKSAVFYQFRAAESLKSCDVTIVPDACVNILLEFDPDDPRTFCSGAFLTPKLLKLKPGIEYFGFKPYSALGLHMGDYAARDMVDKSVPFTEIFPEVSGMVESMSAAVTFEQRVDAFQEFSQAHLIDLQYQPSFVDYMAAIVCSAKTEFISADFERMTGYSDRYCRKRFNDAFGCSPKQYSSIMRLQNTLKSMRWWRSDSLSALAIQHGYYDQAHFIHDFKKYICMTPNAFKKLLETAL
jgi:AraC-like DNA-binding protein